VLLDGSQVQTASGWFITLNSALAGAWEFHIRHRTSSVLVSRCWLAADSKGSDLLWPAVLAAKPITQVPLHRPTTLPWLAVDLQLKSAYHQGLALGDLFGLSDLEQGIAWSLIRFHLRQMSGGDILHITWDVHAADQATTS
jgi:hypothetical protein